MHSGMAFVGSTATDDVVSDFTALGDVVNTTARLASTAASGELLVSVEAAWLRRPTRPSSSGARWRSGSHGPVEVVVVRSAAVTSEP